MERGKCCLGGGEPSSRPRLKEGRGHPGVGVLEQVCCRRGHTQRAGQLVYVPCRRGKDFQCPLLKINLLESVSYLCLECSSKALFFFLTPGKYYMVLLDSTQITHRCITQGQWCSGLSLALNTRIPYGYARSSPSYPVSHSAPSYYIQESSGR